MIMKKQLLLLLIMMLPMAIHAYDVIIDGIYYNLNKSDNTAIVTYKYWGSFNDSGSYSGDIEIPSTIKYNDVEYVVTTIGGEAFMGSVKLTSVIIPKSVTNIDYCAFNSCIGLTSIEIPNSVKTIGSQAFAGCNGLTSINIPNSVTIIKDCAFQNCTNLTSVYIPNSVTSILNYAFSRLYLNGYK